MFVWAVRCILSPLVPVVKKNLERSCLRMVPMKMFTQSDPLTDAELDRLGDFLKACKGGRAMNVEELDGFFAALIAGPETVMPSEYYGRDGGRLRVRQPRRSQ
jgi:hypothetical protein